MNRLHFSLRASLERLSCPTMACLRKACPILRVWLASSLANPSMAEESSSISRFLCSTSRCRYLWLFSPMTLKRLLFVSLLVLVKRDFEEVLLFFSKTEEDDWVNLASLSLQGLIGASSQCSF